MPSRQSEHRLHHPDREYADGRNHCVARTPAMLSEYENICFEIEEVAISYCLEEGRADPK
jgi:hypothetical protein